MDEKYYQSKSRNISKRKKQDNHSIPRFRRKISIPKKNRIRPQSSGASTISRHYETYVTKDEIQHKVLDFSVTENMTRHSARRFREYWKPQNPNRNFQIHPNQNGSKKYKNISAKCVHLPLVYERLFIGNIQFAETYDTSEYSFDTIINLTLTPIAKRSKNTKIHHIHIEDSRRSGIHMYLIKKIIEIILDAIDLNETVLIHCDAGTNRSPFIAILLGMALCSKSETYSKKNFSVTDWISYIEDEKLLQGHTHWDTMTNLYFIHILKSQNIPSPKIYRRNTTKLKLD
jgi:hypothetical protein